MDDILKVYKIPDNKRMHLLTQLRWAQSFGDYKRRASCINARLLSLSVLIYSNMLQESQNLLYAGFIQECVEALQLEETPIILVQNIYFLLLTCIEFNIFSRRSKLKFSRL